MIFDTTYPDKKTIREINNTVGLPFSWKMRWKLKGIGSKRMNIISISEEYRHYLKAEHYITHANIEFRPKGIIIHFRHKLETYSWTMAYENLAIDLQGGIKLESEGKFIRFEQAEEQFIEKLHKLKNS